MLLLVQDAEEVSTYTVLEDSNGDVLGRHQYPEVLRDVVVPVHCRLVVVTKLTRHRLGHRGISVTAVDEVVHKDLGDYLDHRCLSWWCDRG